MAIEIVDFPINSMVIFHSKMLVHQRVNVNGGLEQFDAICTPSTNFIQFLCAILTYTNWQNCEVRGLNMGEFDHYVVATNVRIMG
jgi:hypothetical protein